MIFKIGTVKILLIMKEKLPIKFFFLTFTKDEHFFSFYIKLFFNL